MLCFQRNWFRADLREMARSCSNLQQVDRLHKYAESSTIKVFYWDLLRVPRKQKRAATGASCVFGLISEQVQTFAFTERNGKSHGIALFLDKVAFAAAERFVHVLCNGRIGISHDNHGVNKFGRGKRVFDCGFAFDIGTGVLNVIRNGVDVYIHAQIARIVISALQTVERRGARCKCKYAAEREHNCYCGYNEFLDRKSVV